MVQGPSGPGLDRDQTDIDGSWRFPVPVPKILSGTGLSGLRSGKNGPEPDQTELPQHYQILHCGALKCAFLSLEVEPMLLEYIQDSGHNLPMMFNCVSVYQDIVYVNSHIAFINEVLEDVIYHGLEGGQTVGEAEEHD